MATGVEMLGQMSEDMQLAGPVQGGNMVVKPNEAPVGAAAMLSKALRKEANKGVAGIYELPTPKQPLPDFMKAAKNNVNMAFLLCVTYHTRIISLRGLFYSKKRCNQM